MKYLVCLLVLALTLCATSAFSVAYLEQYEMDASVNLAAGTVYGNTLSVAGGNGTWGPSGSQFSGGIMEFLDDTASSGNQGFYLAPTSTLVGSGYTVDFLYKSLGNTEDNRGKVMSFKGGGNGRGLQIDETGAIFVNGSGHTGTGGGHGFTNWSTCRVIVNGTANTVNLYVWDGVASWVNIANTGMGGSGYAGELGTNGFALGSLAGSSTTAAHFQLDYVRIGGGTGLYDVYDLYQPPVIPEPGGMLALASGLVGMAGFAIRRRRA